MYVLLVVDYEVFSTSMVIISTRLILHGTRMTLIHEQRMRLATVAAPMLYSGRVQRLKYIFRERHIKMAIVNGDCKLTSVSDSLLP